jgi:hypothetical protein
MDTTLTSSDSPRVAGASVRHDDPAPRLARATARTILTTAVLLGISGDALLREGPVGLAFGVWIGTVALAAVSALRSAERTVSRETGAWLVAAVLFSFAFAWRNSDALLFLDFCAVAGCLGMAALASHDPRAALFARRLRETVVGAVAIVRGVLVGVLPLAFRDAFPREDAARVRGRAMPMLRAGLISCALLVVFGALLRDADPIFASLIRLPDIPVDVVVSHLFLTGFFAWIVGGWSRTVALERAHPGHTASEPYVQLGMLDVTAALGTLNVLFGAFVLTQLGWFFGGEAFLRARTGLTVATYARQGFFQLAWVALLVVPVLLATRASLRPDQALARRHTLLSLPIIALLGAIIVSATLRMKMYVHFYGLTTDRLYTLVFMAWLSIVLVWLALTVLREWGQPFVAGVAISGLAVLAVLNVADPDAFVARVNVERAAQLPSGSQPSLDLIHLAGLSGRAVGYATNAILAAPLGQPGTALRGDDDVQRCDASRMLLARWGPTSPKRTRLDGGAAWRFWNADDAAALRVVGSRASQLFAARHLCKAPPPDSH